MPKKAKPMPIKKYPERRRTRRAEDNVSAKWSSQSSCDEDVDVSSPRISVTPSVAGSSPGPVSPNPKKKRAKKTACALDENEETLMCEFIRENDILWDIKKTDYRRVDKKAKLWEDQAAVLGKSVEHIQGWFKSFRDTHTRLHKRKSGDGAPEITEREAWVLKNFDFLRTVVRHHAEPVNSVCMHYS